MEEMLTPKEIAKILHLSYETTLAFVKHSGIDYLKVGNQYRVEASKLRAFVMASGQQNVNLNGVNIYSTFNHQPKKKLNKRGV